MAIHRLKQQGSVAPAQPQPCKAPVNTAACKWPSTIMAICSSTSNTRGDRSKPPTSGTNRCTGLSSGAHSRPIISDMGERVCTQDRIA